VLFDAIPGLDTVDFDYEWDDEPDTDLITDLTIKVAGLAKVSYCPYQDPHWWATVLAAVYKQYGSQPVVRWNLQTYGGADPAQFYDAAKNANAGVSDLSTFIVPGYKANNTKTGGSCPSDIQANLAGLIQYGFTSAFVYNTDIVFIEEQSGVTLLCGGTTNPSPSDYATAIVNGLSGVSGTKPAP
jgi:hypothetical protein